jgi:hypothetical protein
MRAWLLLTLAACSFQHGTVPDVEVDAMPDLDAPPTCVSFSSQFDTCGLAPNDMDLTLTGKNTYNTSTGTLLAGTTTVTVMRMQLAGKAGPVEVVLVRDFHMTANSALRATGSMPLAVLAFGSITIDGGAAIDVSAGGAGARTTCPGGAINGMARTDGAGGGGGGGFAAVGGDGGNGDMDGATPAPGGPGGAALTSAPLGPIGGCPGAKGGDGEDGGGAGGTAGGAIYLVAANRIDIAPGASVHAGGGGGAGGAISTFSSGDGGGGGGGSGGMILIESAIVRSAGSLAANGGAGGEASGNGDSGNGGAPGGVTAAAAMGGGGNSATGTDGGNGGALASPPGASVMGIQAGGGGGGGGSVGFIFVQSDDAMVMFSSPNPS